MSIIVIGASGLIGNTLCQLLKNQDVIAVDINPRNDNIIKLDMTSISDLNSHFKEFNPKIVYLPAFITGVDQCELDEELNKINYSGISNVVEICKKHNCKLLFYSSDYVFDGKNGPYLETDKPNPINKYGKTKLLCEKKIQDLDDYLIIRTTVVYGYDENSLNFLMTFTRDLMNGKVRRVPQDQIGSPTLVEDLAKISIKLVDNNKKGIYNIVGPDLCSRYIFALKIARIFGLDEKLAIPVNTSEFKQPAKRPLRAGLIIDKIRKDIDANPSGIDKSLKKLKNYFIK